MTEQRPRPVRAWVAYTGLRLLLFLAPFLAIWALSGNPTLSAVFGAVIGLSLSVILLDGQRSALGGLLAARADRRRPSTDESVEDRALDAPATPGDGPVADQTDSAAASPRP